MYIVPALPPDRRFCFRPAGDSSTIPDTGEAMCRDFAASGDVTVFTRLAETSDGPHRFASAPGWWARRSVSLPSAGWASGSPRRRQQAGPVVATVNIGIGQAFPFPGAWFGTFGPPTRAQEGRACANDDAGRQGERGQFARLDHAESLRLLATVPVGRLIFTVNALPAVRLMNFVMADGLILMRTAADSHHVGVDEDDVGEAS